MGFLGFLKKPDISAPPKPDAPSGNVPPPPKNDHPKDLIDEFSSDLPDFTEQDRARAAAMENETPSEPPVQDSNENIAEPPGASSDDTWMPPEPLQQSGTESMAPLEAPPLQQSEAEPNSSQQWDAPVTDQPQDTDVEQSPTYQEDPAPSFSSEQPVAPEVPQEQPMQQPQDAPQFDDSQPVQTSQDHADTSPVEKHDDQWDAPPATEQQDTSQAPLEQQPNTQQVSQRHVEQNPEHDAVPVWETPAELPELPHVNDYLPVSVYKETLDAVKVFKETVKKGTNGLKAVSTNMNEHKQKFGGYADLLNSIQQDLLAMDNQLMR